MIRSHQLLRGGLARTSRLFGTKAFVFNKSSSEDFSKDLVSKTQKTGVDQKPNSGYVPKLSYERVTYEYPPPPKAPKFVPDESKPWKRHIPALAAVLGIAWAMYAYKYFLSGDKTSSEKILEPDQFAKFKITFKEDISEDLQLIELSPNYEQYRNILKSKESNMWNGKRLWSVEVKQPEIQVVRRYTPLPMYYMQGLEGKSLLRLLGGQEEDEGRMVLLVKKYNDGEVSRWLHRMPVGSTVELRGPFVGHRFPYSPIDKAAGSMRETMEDLPSRMSVEPEGLAQELGVPEPENIAFFAGGTGIAPILQSLFSKNPPRGHVDVYLSVKDRSEVPIKRFLLFLEKTGRAKFHYFVDNENKFIGENDIPEPAPLQYLGYRNDDLTEELNRERELREAMDEVRREKSGLPPTPKEHRIIDLKTESTQLSFIKTNTDQVKVKNSSMASPPVKYRTLLEQAAAWSEKSRTPASIAVVCGPPGYVEYISGRRDLSGRGPIAGLLGARGWTNANVFRME